MPSGAPANAQLNGEGFRFYRWEDPVTGEATDLLSVTSIRKLCGESYTLVNWQLGNLLDTVLGTVKRPAIGKRGKPLKGKYIYVPEEYPSEFFRMYEEAVTDDGKPQQSKFDDLRKWARERADDPRNIAARRGTMVHTAIERNVAFDRIERPWVEAAFMDLSYRDRASARQGVTDADVTFVRRSVANYWDMRNTVPFVIIAREPQVFNLTAGYGGSADGLIWFLPEGYDPTDLPKPHELTLKFIQSVGGFTAVGDWKTSGGVFTDHVVQVHAYGAAEFVGTNGVVDHRLTDILQSTQRGVLFHIRPEHWAVHPFDFSEPVFRAFFGSVAFARFLAMYPKPDTLFLDLPGTWRGSAAAEEDEA